MCIRNRLGAADFRASAGIRVAGQHEVACLLQYVLSIRCCDDVLWAEPATLLLRLMLQ